MLIAHPKGHYRFLQGIDPYSCGVVAEPGWEIVRVVLAEPLPWREGFERVDAHLAAEGCERVSLCAMELRSPVPFTMQGFIDFNREYCAVLRAWGLYVDELNPVARLRSRRRSVPAAARQRARSTPLGPMATRALRMMRTAPPVSQPRKP